MELSFKNVALKYEDNEPTLKNVTGKIRMGKLTAVMGPSGCGKTTFINTLCGFVEPNAKTNGEILWNGEERTKNFVEIVSHLSQDDHFDEKLTVKEFLFYNAIGNNRGKNNDEINNDINFLLEKTHLLKKENAPLSTLSGGERKRVMVITELLSDSQLVFLDEPTSGLDSHLAIGLIYFLKDGYKDKTFVVVMHQPSPLILRAIDDLIYLYKGKTMYCGEILDVEQYFENFNIKKTEEMSFYEFIFLVGSDDFFNEKIECQKKTFSNIFDSIPVEKIEKSEKSFCFSPGKQSFKVFFYNLKRYLYSLIFCSNQGQPPLISALILLFFSTFTSLMSLESLAENFKVYFNPVKFPGFGGILIFFIIFYVHSLVIVLQKNEFLKIEIRKRHISFLEYFIIEFFLFSMVNFPIILIHCFIFSMISFKIFFFHFFVLSISYLVGFLQIFALYCIIPSTFGFQLISMLLIFINQGFIIGVVDYNRLLIINTLSNTLFSKPIISLYSRGLYEIFGGNLDLLLDRGKDGKYFHATGGILGIKTQMGLTLCVQSLFFLLGMYIRHKRIVPHYRFRLRKNDN